MWRCQNIANLKRIKGIKLQQFFKNFLFTLIFHYLLKSRNFEDLALVRCIVVKTKRIFLETILENQTLDSYQLKIKLIC